MARAKLTKTVEIVYVIQTPRGTFIEGNDLGFLGLTKNVTKARGLQRQVDAETIAAQITSNMDKRAAKRAWRPNHPYKNLTVKELEITRKYRLRDCPTAPATTVPDSPPQSPQSAAE